MIVAALLLWFIGVVGQFDNYALCKCGDRRCLAYRPYIALLWSLLWPWVVLQRFYWMHVR